MIKRKEPKKRYELDAAASNQSSTKSGTWAEQLKIVDLII